MLSAFKALARSFASYAALLFALACLAGLALLPDSQPDARLAWPPVVAVDPAEEEEEDAIAVAEAPEAPHDARPPAPAAAPAPRKRERPLVMVDAGHGGGDGGAVFHGIIEKNLALVLAQKLRTELQSQGIDVRMTRSKDEFISLEGRAAMAERARADALVSLHLNSAGNEAGVHGLETYYSGGKSLAAARLLQAAFKLPTITGLRDRRGERLAALVQRHACQSTGAANRGTKERAYTVVHGASCPAILVECGFISNPKEAARLKTADYQNKMIAGIARGVVTFLQAQELDPRRGIELPEPAPAAPVLMGPPHKSDLLSHNLPGQ